MREVMSFENGILRVVRRGIWYRVLRGSVVVSTHWTKRAALNVVVEIYNREGK